MTLKAFRVLLLAGLLVLPLACGGPTSPVSTLAVATTSLRDGVRTVAYSDTLRASGGNGDYAWSLSVGLLPTGLSLNTSTGEISGTPTVVETRNLTVQVTSADGQTAQRSLSISVSAALILLASDLCSANPSTAIPMFEDANLLAIVRSDLGLGAGENPTCGVLSALNTLSAPSAGIVSLVGIQNLTSLTSLDLSDNSITDIGALSGLTSLTLLDLSDNLITDIQPLLDNAGLGAGDTVDLSGMILSCADVDTLEARSVTVMSTCP